LKAYQKTYPPLNNYTLHTSIANYQDYHPHPVF
jgi:hypothetical protein